MEGGLSVLCVGRGAGPGGSRAGPGRASCAKHVQSAYWVLSAASGLLLVAQGNLLLYS